MTHLFKSIPPNLNGKDYICSDIHGHFSLLESILTNVGFNKSVDRLFSLGDLIDRGPESERALEWLSYDWFYAIQGNHERMLINAMDQPFSPLLMQWHAWGGTWAEHLSQQELSVYYQTFVHLPVALELELSNGKRVGLVHAELPDVCDWNDVKETLINCAPIDVEKDLFISDMLWNKNQIYRDEGKRISIEPVKNIDHVFHGHTIVDVVTTFQNRTFMDLGSYLNDNIGVINPLEFV